MSYIKIDHKKISVATDAIEAYMSLMKKNMVNMQNEVVGLSANWQGADFANFQAQWRKVVKEGSTYSEMLKSLNAYSSHLKTVKKIYVDAQIEAVNRANWLPKW